MDMSFVNIELLSFNGLIPIEIYPALLRSFTFVPTRADVNKVDIVDKHGDGIH